MKCPNCGSDVNENEKFCGNCGNPVSNPVEESKVEEAPAAEERSFTSFATEVSNETQETRQPIDATLSIDKPEVKEQIEKTKGNKKTAKIILTILAIIVVVGIIVFLCFKFLYKESYTKSIDTMEKSLEKLVKDDITSETVKVKIQVKASEMSISASGFLKFAKDGDNVKIHIGVDKNDFIDKTDMYVEANKEGGSAYVPSGIFGSLLGTGSASAGWTKYTVSLSDLGLGELVEASETAKEEEELDLTTVLPEGTFKYVGRSGGLKQYRLYLNEEFFKNMKDMDTEDLPVSMDSIKDMNLAIDFYINSKDELKKIEMDLKDYFKSLELDVKSAKITIEFTDINSTKVEIPADVKASAVEESILDTITDGGITTSSEYDAEDIYYDIMLSASVESCYTESFEVDFKNYNDELVLDDDEYDITRIKSGKIKFSVPESGTDCVVEVVEPIVIDGKTCVKDTTSYSKYAGTCK